MDLITRFTDYLNSPENKLSNKTVKNYKADIGSFINWYKKQYNQELAITPGGITSQIIELYKKTKIQESNLSSNSLKRHLSSLRRFFKFLKANAIITSDPFEETHNLNIKTIEPLPKINTPSILTKIKWRLKGKPLFIGETIRYTDLPKTNTVQGLPIHKKMWQYIYKWYIIAILILFISQIGFILYQDSKYQLLETYINNVAKSAADNNSDKILGASSKQNSFRELESVLKIADTTGSAEAQRVLKVGGDIVTSGSATFNKLNLNIAENTASLSPKEIIATGSAGSAWISSGETEAVINNTIITDKSLIYITSIGTPSGQIPFLIRQVPSESFTVGIASSSATNTFFNWLIIN